MFSVCDGVLKISSLRVQIPLGNPPPLLKISHYVCHNKCKILTRIYELRINALVLYMKLISASDTFFTSIFSLECAKKISEISNKLIHCPVSFVESVK